MHRHKKREIVKSVKWVDLSVKQLGCCRYFLHIFATSNQKRIFLSARLQDNETGSDNGSNDGTVGLLDRGTKRGDGGRLPDVADGGFAAGVRGGDGQQSQQPHGHLYHQRRETNHRINLV